MRTLSLRPSRFSRGRLFGSSFPHFFGHIEPPAPREKSRFRPPRMCLEEYGSERLRRDRPSRCKNIGAQSYPPIFSIRALISFFGAIEKWGRFSSPRDPTSEYRQFHGFGMRKSGHRISEPPAGMTGVKEHFSY